MVVVAGQSRLFVVVVVMLDFDHILFNGSSGLVSKCKIVCLVQCILYFLVLVSKPVPMAMTLVLFYYWVIYSFISPLRYKCYRINLLKYGVAVAK